MNHFLLHLDCKFKVKKDGSFGDFLTGKVPVAPKIDMRSVGNFVLFSISLKIPFPQGFETRGRGQGVAIGQVTIIRTVFLRCGIL